MRLVSSLNINFPQSFRFLCSDGQQKKKILHLTENLGLRGIMVALVVVQHRSWDLHCFWCTFVIGILKCIYQLILAGSSCDQDSFTYNSRYMTDTDSGLGRATPPHRTSSPAPNTSSSSGPGSLPPSNHSRRLRYDDTASESGGSEYSGLR